jgi:sec-independent protein translocase protein TatA
MIFTRRHSAGSGYPPRYHGLMPFGVGPLEIIIVLVIVLLSFGPKRLPDLGRSLGSGMREFKDSVTGKDKDELPERQDAADEPRPTTPAAEPRATTTAGEQKP